MTGCWIPTKPLVSPARWAHTRTPTSTTFPHPRVCPPSAVWCFPGPPTKPFALVRSLQGIKEHPWYRQPLPMRYSLPLQLLAEEQVMRDMGVHRNRNVRRRDPRRRSHQEGEASCGCWDPGVRGSGALGQLGCEAGARDVLAHAPMHTLICAPHVHIHAHTLRVRRYQAAAAAVILGGD